MCATFCSIYLFIFTTLILIFAIESKKLSFRLPTNVEPVSYQINLIPHLDNHDFTFDGETNIRIKIHNATDVIVLHANNLHIHTVILLTNELKEIQPIDYSVDNKTDFLTIKFDKLLKFHEYQLYIKYERIAKSVTTGFLRHSYKDYSNRRLWMAFTQLEPTGARKVFPCWDEPALKAEFTIVITHSNKYTAISNMHSVNSEIDENNPNLTTTYFAETPKMSTYLVGIIISNFSYIDSKNGLIRVYSRHNVIDKVKHILDIGEKALNIMHNYTSISYEMFGFNKLDIVVLPNIAADIAGMENWGLITVQETSAIIEEGVTLTDAKEWTTKVIAHECAHQWFGNLITINWWSDLWINEGITTYFHFMIANQIEETWHIMDRFAVDSSLVHVWNSEAKEDAIAIKMNIENPNDMVWSKYYHTYYKSAYIIQMVFYIVGEKNFQNVWQTCLTERKFQSVTADYIIGEFAKISDLDKNIFVEIFNNWLTTPGFPIITVRRNYNNGKLFIEQTRYFNHKTTHNKEKYWIPLNYATENDFNFENVEVTHWMSPKNQSIEISGFDKNKWVIFNKQQFGFYCVNYDENNWNLIIKTLKSKDYIKIHVRNRLQLINDAFKLVRVNRMNHKTILSLIGYLEQETDLIPWIPFWSGIEYLKNYVKYTKYVAPLERYIVKLMNNIMKNLSFDALPDDNHLIKYYRSRALGLACKSGSKLCLNAATQKLSQWLHNPAMTYLVPELKKIILCYGLRHAGNEVWKSLWFRWLKNPDYHVLQALGCISNKSNLMQLLYGVAGFDKIHHTVFLPYAINAVATGSRAGVFVAISFLIEHWRPVIEITPQPIIKNLIFNVSRSVSNDNHFYMLQDFISMRYHDLVMYGVQPQKLVDEGLQLLKYYKTAHPVYDEFFSSS